MGANRLIYGFSQEIKTHFLLNKAGPHWYITGKVRKFFEILV
jgi:hypothetical protein